MNSTPEQTRFAIYGLLVTAAAAMTAGHIVGVERVYEPSAFKPDGKAERPSQAWPTKRPAPTPTLRSNDRSRWATVRALVEEGTYVIGRRDPSRATAENKYGDRGIIFEDGWDSVDKVLRPDTGEFYSSKPPLLATLVAGEYWLLQRGLGWSIVKESERGWVVRTILLTFNGVLPVIYFVLLARLIDRLGTTDWGRLYVLTAACFGTFMTTFAIALNNHLVAGCCVPFALYPALRIWKGEQKFWSYALAGFFAALTACIELPATAFAVALLLIVMARSAWRTIAFFLPFAAIPVAAFFLTNYLAIGQWQLAYSEFGGPWYEYGGSHWERRPDQIRSGIDWASEKESRAAYAFHFLVGHHGVFSLSPIWLLAVAGVVLGLKVRSRPETPVEVAERPNANGSPRWDERRLIAALTLGLTVIVIGFYLGRPRWNYGGGTVGPRWLIWLTPLWLLVLLPAADWLGKFRSGRAVGLALLAVSIFSAAYPLWTPWRHPWIYDWMNAKGWIPY